MVDVKENSNGVALLEEKVMAALTQLIVSSLLEKEELNAPENSDRDFPGPAAKNKQTKR